MSFPADPAALRDGGVAFLTNAFHASGALGGQNRVARIARCEEVPAAAPVARWCWTSTTEEPHAELPTELFVKFSRDFDDPVRDRGRTQMESEVQVRGTVAAPGFPDLGAARSVRRLSPRQRHGCPDQ